MQQIEHHIRAQALRIHEAIIRRLQYLGEQCLAEARNNKTYMDQTGNLTSSMGYVILFNGHVQHRGGFAGSGEGASQGEQTLQKVSAQYSKGYALIVCAGMGYAAYVESKGYNVLTSAEMLAEKELPKLMKALSKNISKAL
jgi:hypothetical protein